MKEIELQVICPACEDQFEVATEPEPADPNYGADADGNRGTYLPGYIPAPEPPDECPICKHEFNAEEREDLRRKLEQAAKDYEEEEPEPDYDYQADCLYEDWKDRQMDRD